MNVTCQNPICGYSGPSHKEYKGRCPYCSTIYGKRLYPFEARFLLYGKICASAIILLILSIYAVSSTPPPSPTSMSNDVIDPEVMGTLIVVLTLRAAMTPAQTATPDIQPVINSVTDNGICDDLEFSISYTMRSCSGRIEVIDNDEQVIHTTDILGGSHTFVSDNWKCDSGNCTTAFRVIDPAGEQSKLFPYVTQCRPSATVTPETLFRATVNVTTNSANIRAAPSLTATITTRLANGTQVEVIERQNDWYRILFRWSSRSSPSYGWIHRDLIRQQ